VSLNKRDDRAIGLLRAAGVPKDLDWVAMESVSAYEEMGDPRTTAQVHPYQFTTSIATLAESAGAKIILGSASRINQKDGAVTSVTYKEKETGEEKILDADTVILTAGPWTREVWPKAPITALRAHSVTIRPSKPVSAYCLFTSIEMPAAKSGRRGQTVTPEIYARPNNEIYACGEGDQLIKLPKSSDLVQVDESRCQDIVDQVSSISDELRDGEVTARQACYLPNVEGRGGGGGPLIGETSVRGLLIGAGHTCWGIQNAPGTGKCLSELVWEGGVKSARLESLDPRRFGL
jgi:glycine/D-amino acid oxidase-like deaminating enzyme